MDQKLYKVGLEFKAAEVTGDGILTIEGMASTNAVDSYNEIVEPEAFRETMESFMQHPLLLFGHDWYSMPVGKVVEWQITNKGLWIKAELADTAPGRDVAELIKFGILKAFSIGFTCLLREEGQDGEPARIKKLQLWEISVVNVPACSEALFDEAKQKNINLTALSTKSPDGGSTHKKESVMDQQHLEAIANCEKLVGGFGDSLDSVSGDLGKLKTDFETHAQLMNQALEKVEQEKEGRITSAEFKTFADKIGTDIMSLKEEMQKVENARRLLSDRPSAIDILHKASPRKLDDEGKPFNELQQKAYNLFLQPVEYEGPEGYNLKLLRDALDTCLIVDAVMKANYARVGTGRYAGITSLKSYGVFKEMVQVVDPEFYKAMYSTGSGVGDEWVPEFMSAELYDLYELSAVLESYIPHFEMPTNPYKWPILTSKPTMYRAGEAAVNNPDELTKSDAGTSNVTFTAETFAVAVPVSPQAVEDAIISMMEEIRRTMADAMRSGYESLLVNGDNTSTHRDTESGYTSASPESYEDGFRMLAIDRSASFDTQSATANVGDGTSAFAAADVRYLRRLMGVYGKNPAECVYYTSITPYFYMMSFVQNTQAGTYGANATWSTGTLDKFDGCDVAVTSELVETLAATGLATSSATTNTHKAIGCFNKTAFRIGEKRGFTVEAEKNVRTQQYTLVSTFRKSFQTLAPSTLDPCSYGYNIE